MVWELVEKSVPRVIFFSAIFFLDFNGFWVQDPEYPESKYLNNRCSSLPFGIPSLVVFKISSGGF